MCHRFGSNIMTTTALESPSASSMVRLSGPLVELTAADATTTKDNSSDLPERIEIIFIHLLSKNNITIYRTRAIITRGLYTFYPLFEGQKCFFKDVFSENSAFMYG